MPRLYDYNTAFGGLSLTITRRKGGSVHLQGDDAAEALRAIEKAGQHAMNFCHRDFLEDLQLGEIFRDNTPE